MIPHGRTASCHAGSIAEQAAAALQAVLTPRTLLATQEPVQYLAILRPGLYGCVDVPRAADPLKPHAKIRDATAALLQALPDALHPAALAVLQDAVLRAGDKAPVRTNVAEAAVAVAAHLNAPCRASWLNFVSQLLLAPAAASRMLGLQALELMMAAILDDSFAEHCAGVRAVGTTLIAHSEVGDAACKRPRSVHMFEPGGVHTSDRFKENAEGRGGAGGGGRAAVRASELRARAARAALR